MNPLSDIAVIKVLGIFAESLSAISLTGAYFVWKEYCKNVLPNSGLEYTNGPGFIFCALALTLTICLVVMHVMIPTIDPSIADPGCCSAKRQEAKGGSTRNLAAVLEKKGSKQTNKMEMSYRKGTKAEAQEKRKSRDAKKQQQQQQQQVEPVEQGPKVKYISGYQSSRNLAVEQ
jgi:hypothetical protein